MIELTHHRAGSMQPALKQTGCLNIHTFLFLYIILYINLGTYVYKNSVLKRQATGNAGTLKQHSLMFLLSQMAQNICSGSNNSVPNSTVQYFFAVE